MSEDIVKIEVDGQIIDAHKGQMLIDATDAAGIYIPRFCYHKKLAVAANCRMCLVEVEKAPKPMPACATPVMPGMKVHTDSKKAIAAQKGTMEFLLINHPLDCPICDQGGECELQDLAMGYGRSVSQFSERKRAVRDKNIGPLIRTEMTRCIHCTRCVRFGEEIANMRELGATGRGEKMEIGTYIEKELISELSGNVIDLCPVGALTAKPSRYTGRSWEYVQHEAVSPHDAVGSNLYIHTLRGRVMRVVPRENEPVNETWIADRDRFSYEGLFSEDRIGDPIIKQSGSWQPVEWERALAAAAEGLQAVINAHGPDAVGVLLSPNATLEELYLAQKLARGLGIANVDHRLRQSDFSDQDQAPVYPWLGMPLAELEQLSTVLLIGSNIRLEQPLAAHRLRKACHEDAQVLAVNPRNFDLTLPLAANITGGPGGMINALAGIAKAVAKHAKAEVPDTIKALVENATPSTHDKQYAKTLLRGETGAVLLGTLAMQHPAFSHLRALALFIAEVCDIALGYLPEGANAVGAWLSGALPHRDCAGEPTAQTGMNARTMLEQARKAYILLGVEPEFDCADPATAVAAVQQADFVLSLTPFAGPGMRGYADVMLPIAAFSETEGSFVNMEGRCQSFAAAAKPYGNARPAWKVLRVLGNRLDLDGFDYPDAPSILDEVLTRCSAVEPHNRVANTAVLEPFEARGLWRIGDIPIYSVDPLVRRAPALQQTVWAQQAQIRLHPDTAQEFDLANADSACVCQSGAEHEFPLILDEEIPLSCIWLPGALEETRQLGPLWGAIEIRPVGVSPHPKPLPAGKRGL